MKPIAFAFIAMLVFPAICTADELASANNIAELELKVDKANAAVNELAAELHAAKAADPTSLPEVEALTKQLVQAVHKSFDVRTELQLAKLADADAKIAASRLHIAQRQKQADAIVGKRLETLLNASADAQSPQAALDAMERFTATDNYEGLIGLLTDDAADQMAGMLMHSMSTMKMTLALLESAEAIDEAEEVRRVIASGERFMRPNPHDEAVAALKQISEILPAMFYEIGATSNGKPLNRPNYTAEQYSALLRQASGVLSDTRAFSVAMLTAASALGADTNETPVKSKWKIDRDGLRAVATQQALPIDKTTNKTGTVVLVMENGHWKIAKLGSDQDMMDQIFGQRMATTPTSPQAGSFPSQPAHATSPPPPVDAPEASAFPVPSGLSPYSQQPFYPESAAAMMKERMQGRWVVANAEMTDGKGNALPGKMELHIMGNVMQQVVQAEDTSDTKVALLKDVLQSSSSGVDTSGVLPIDFVFDPNGDAETFQGIVFSDGETLSICISKQLASSGMDFRPKLFVPGSKVSLYECVRVDKDLAILPESLQGRWQVNTFVEGGAATIAKGRFVDPDGQLTAFSDTIPHDELLAGPWILEIGNGNVSLRHGPSNCPIWSLDITGEADSSFAVAIPESALNSSLAAFAPELKDQLIGGRYNIEGDKLTLCMSERKATTDKVKLAPTADRYFECVREQR